MPLTLQEVFVIIPKDKLRIDLSTQEVYISNEEAQISLDRLDGEHEIMPLSEAIPEIRDREWTAAQQSVQ